MSDPTPVIRDPKRYATTDGQPPAPGCENASAPKPINGSTGQHGAYWVLTEEERKKGFVRPVRDRYTHAGTRPKHPTRLLTEEERQRYASVGYVKFEDYPENDRPPNRAVGRYWTEKQLESGCGMTTRMGPAIAETYARDPKFYGSTFCSTCRQHLPLPEFRWINVDGTPSDEILGS